MSCSLERRRQWIQPAHPQLSVRAQCRLLGLARASLYYAALPESAENLQLMRLLDEEYTRHPFYGVPRMTFWLQTGGHRVGPKRVRRLLRLMGLLAVYPKPRLSFNPLEHRRFPYLLRGVALVRPNQVWSTDITYIRLRGGFVYLAAVIDWFSRYVLAWELSTTLEVGFCVAVVERALLTQRPEIFNTDQGVQYTAEAFTGRLEAAGVRVSMDGRGRWMDNVFVERLWRTVKYEHLYLHDYTTPRALAAGLSSYFLSYNVERIHSSLDYRTPMAVYLAT